MRQRSCLCILCLLRQQLCVCRLQQLAGLGDGQADVGAAIDACLQQQEECTVNVQASQLRVAVIRIKATKACQQGECKRPFANLFRSLRQGFIVTGILPGRRTIVSSVF